MRTKRMSGPQEEVSKDEKSKESATKSASSHADFAERYEDKHWSGSGSGFV